MSSQGEQEPVMEDVLASIKKILSEDDDDSSNKGSENLPENVPESLSPESKSLSDGDENINNQIGDDIVEEKGLSEEPIISSRKEEIEELEVVEETKNDDPLVKELKDGLSEIDDVLKENQGKDDTISPDVISEIEENPPIEDENIEVGEEIASIDEVDEVDEVDEISNLDNTNNNSEFKATGKESLVAEKVKDMSGKHFSDLAKVVAEERSISIGNHGLSLEELVREILTPILKDWLDENLPHMVERIVKQEIEMIVSRSERLDDS